MTYHFDRLDYAGTLRFSKTIFCKGVQSTQYADGLRLNLSRVLE